MDMKSWYERRQEIVAQQERLKPIVEDLEKHLRAQIERLPNDPVTKKEAVWTSTVPNGFSIMSATNATVQVVLPPTATAIDVVPPISVLGRRVAKIYGVQSGGPNASFIVERPADGDVGVQLPYLLTALIEAVMTE